MSFRDWPAYVPVAERRRRAAAEMKRHAKAGRAVSPVEITGRAIATTAWGKAWCDNLEAYSDFASRLPRGRTYVRNGSVVDLQIAPGVIAARVMGSELYEVKVKVTALAAARWRALCGECAGGIDSLVELLAGRIAAGVMTRMCRPKDGVFPAPRELTFSCSCPDYAEMCKHVAAVLYGIGARLDHAPELLFTLRKVDASELVAEAGAGLAAGPAMGGRGLVEADLGALFGLEMDGGAGEPAALSAAQGREAAVKKAAPVGRAAPRVKAAEKKPAVRPASRGAAPKVKPSKVKATRR
jgi:hypothetical protein